MNADTHPDPDLDVASDFFCDPFSLDGNPPDLDANQGIYLTFNKLLLVVQGVQEEKSIL
jgi:hypothetical protein